MGKVLAGGALAIGVANKVLMLENAIYSILSPEGFASILWKDQTKVKEAAEKMKLTAKDLFELGVIDKVIKEPKEENEDSFLKLTNNLKKEINKALKEFSSMTKEEIVEDRYCKFRKMGNFEERN